MLKRWHIYEIAQVHVSVCMCVRVCVLYVCVHVYCVYACVCMPVCVCMCVCVCACVRVWGVSVCWLCMCAMLEARVASLGWKWCVWCWKIICVRNVKRFVTCM